MRAITGHCGALLEISAPSLLQNTTAPSSLKRSRKASYRRKTAGRSEAGPGNRGSSKEQRGMSPRGRQERAKALRETNSAKSGLAEHCSAAHSIRAASCSWPARRHGPRILRCGSCSLKLESLCEMADGSAPESEPRLFRGRTGETGILSPVSPGSMGSESRQASVSNLFIFSRHR